MVESIGKYLVIGGIILVIIGLMFPFFLKLGLGKLPGDILIKKGSFTFYFPVVTSILLSLLLTFILNVVFRRR